MVLGFLCLHLNSTVYYILPKEVKIVRTLNCSWVHQRFSTHPPSNCDVPPEHKQNLHSALLIYCLSVTCRRLYLRVRHSGGLLNHWSGILDFLISVWLILTSWWFDGLEISNLTPFFKPSVCPAAVQFHFYFYFFWKNSNNPIPIEQRHGKLWNHFASISLII